MSMLEMGYGIDVPHRLLIIMPRKLDGGARIVEVGVLNPRVQSVAQFFSPWHSEFVDLTRKLRPGSLAPRPYFFLLVAE